MNANNETPAQRREDLPEILRNKFYKSNMDAIAFMAVCYKMGEDAARAEMFTRDQVIEAMDEALRRYFMRKPSAIEIFKMKDEIINQIKKP